MMKFWIYENHICELRSEELNEGWSSQLYTQLLQLRKESLKKIQACTEHDFHIFITSITERSPEEEVINRGGATRSSPDSHRL